MRNQFFGRKSWLFLLCSFVMLMMLGACDTGWLGEDEEPPLPGERIAVLKTTPDLVEFRKADDPYCHPAQIDDNLLPQFDRQNLDANKRLIEIWRQDIGASANEDRKLLSIPVVARGQVFAIDAVGKVTAMAAQSGKIIWQQDFEEELEDDDVVLSGSLAVSGSYVIVATGYAKVFALDFSTGDILWQKTVAGPVRSTPAIRDGRVFILTVDNKLEVLDLQQGKQLWSHRGTSEVAGLLGGSRVAVGEDVVVVPYSSGEIYALRLDNGRPLWGESLATVGRYGTGITDILAWPVIAGDQVFAMSHRGRTVAVDLKTGRREWELPVGGTQTPSVVGDYLYVVTDQDETACVARADGAVHWLVDLHEYSREEEESDYNWIGPVFAGDRLLMMSPEGEILSLSPVDGKMQGRLKIPGAVHVPPVIADNVLYILTEDAMLYALRAE